MPADVSDLAPDDPRSRLLDRLARRCRATEARLEQARTDEEAAILAAQTRLRVAEADHQDALGDLAAARRVAAGDADPSSDGLVGCLDCGAASESLVCDPCWSAESLNRAVTQRDAAEAALARAQDWLDALRGQRPAAAGTGHAYGRASPSTGG